MRQRCRYTQSTSQERAKPMTVKQMTDTEYHADPAIGSTTAKLGLTNTPLLSLALQGRYRMEDKPCFVAGRLLHMAVLEHERFQKLVTAEGPINPRTGGPYGRSTKAFQEWQEQHPKITVIDPWIYDAIGTMPGPVKDILKSGQGEESHFSTINGIAAKCRADWINHDIRRFWDLKSISTQGEPMEVSIDRAIRNRSYWFSLAWYKAVLKESTGRPYTCSLIFTEKEPPNRWRVVDVDFEYEQLGDREVVRVCSLIRAFNDAKGDARRSVLDEDDDDIYYQSACPEYLLWDEFGLGE